MFIHHQKGFWCFTTSHESSRVYTPRFMPCLLCFLQLSVTHLDDWSRFARTLMEIRANRADGEEEGLMELAS